ncbi:MAG: TonB-dependent receptor plug domain-containing protein [Bacteroidota bacterium]
MKRIALLIFGIFLMSAHHAQTKVVTGHVTMFHKYPVANLEVFTKKAKTSATTDAYGNFEIICDEKDIILIKEEVFQSARRRVGRDDEFVGVNLIYKDSQKNRQLAVHLGYISQEQLSYAVKNLQHENTDFCNYSDVFALLKGKFPEVVVVRSLSGGEDVYMKRGVRSIAGDNSAIYVVDGVKTSTISTLSPCDIISISIVKSGTAMYGADAANGVVVIKTKRGR